MSRPRILIGEDSKVVIKLLETALGAGYEVESARDGLEVLHKIESGGSWNALILDLIMPHKGGLEVLAALREQGRNIHTLVITAQARLGLEAEVLALGAEQLLTKPLDYRQVVGLVASWCSGAPAGQAPVPLPGAGAKGRQPFETRDKCCYICGYEKVKVFMPVRDGFDEDWSAGVFPIFTSRPGFAPWDQMRTLMAVCPACFFASHDPTDFSASTGDQFPYLSDAKKILSRNMGARKKMVAGSLAVDDRYDSPWRNQKAVLESLHFGEKCMNGLILGEKPGAFAQLGYYQMFLGCFDRASSEKYYLDALVSFQNQLKSKQTPPPVWLFASFFCIAINMVVGRSNVAKDIMHQLADRYNEKRPEDMTEGEKIWLQRTSALWTNGIDRSEKFRQIAE